jgi:hypothetical protein
MKLNTSGLKPVDNPKLILELSSLLKGDNSGMYNVKLTREKGV